MPGLSQAYGLKFGKLIQVDPNLMYPALENDNVEVIAAFTTDAKLKKYDVISLKDDRGFYPPYVAAAVIRAPILDSHPQPWQFLQLQQADLTAMPLLEL